MDTLKSWVSGFFLVCFYHGYGSKRHQYPKNVPITKCDLSFVVLLMVPISFEDIGKWQSWVSMLPLSRSPWGSMETEADLHLSSQRESSLPSLYLGLMIVS